MRKLILKMSMSLDGFVGSLDGRNDWMFGNDPAPKAWSVEALWDASLHVMGSRTFRSMAAHWPAASDAFAGPMNAIPKAVFSRQGRAILDGVPSGPGGWAEAQVFEGDLAEHVARLKAGDGKPIIAHGGANLARSLVAAGLVDRFMLLVHPVLLGSGLSAFSSLAAPAALQLAASRRFPGGAMSQVYDAA